MGPKPEPTALKLEARKFKPETANLEPINPDSERGSVKSEHRNGKPELTHEMPEPGNARPKPEPSEPDHEFPNSQLRAGKSKSGDAINPSHSSPRLRGLSLVAAERQLWHTVRMKPRPEKTPRKKPGQEHQTPPIGELEGFLKLGMKDQALRLVRQTLESPVMTADRLNDALDAILQLAGKLKPWTRLVESAYERLHKRERPAVRCSMISFRHSSGDHEGILQLMPRRSSGELEPTELAFSIEAAFALGKTDAIKSLAKRLPPAIRETDDPITRSLLILCLAEVHARNGQWDDSISYFEVVLSNATLSQNAVDGIVEIHSVRALLALKQGFGMIEQFNQQFLPEIELQVPGNERAVQDEAANKFRRLQKLLEKIVPEKRQRELGLHPKP